MAQRQFHTLQNNLDIARFVVEGNATGRQLGIGSYGSVEEVAIYKSSPWGIDGGAIYIIQGGYANTPIPGH